MSSALDTYLYLCDRLDMLRQYKLADDELLDAMDTIWLKMTDKERAAVEICDRPRPS